MKNNFLKKISIIVLVAVIVTVTMAFGCISASAKTSYNYKLTINTADVSKAGTDKDVYIYAYDVNGSLIDSRIKLDGSGNDFEKGDTDTFTITLSKPMKSVKVATFGHADNLFDTFEDDWKVDSIVAELIDGDKVLSTVSFRFNQWVECGWYSYVSGNKWPVAEVEQLYSPSEILRENGLEFAPIDRGVAEIIGYTGDEKVVVVPEYIDGYKVTSIGEFAFKDCTALTEAVVSDTVTSIGKGAFAGCTSLENVKLSDNTTYIADNAFMGCCSLKSITLPANLKTIGDYAFCNCGLTKVAIPEGVTDIGNKAFYGCSLLNSASVPASVTNVGTDIFGGCASDLYISGYSKAVREYAEEKGIEFSSPVEDFKYKILDNGTVEITFYNDKNTDVVIPETIEGRKVTSIGEMAFTASKVTSVVVPDSVTEIKYLAFALCDSLTNITLPENLYYIGVDAFAHCGKLAKIEIPAKTEHIMDSAFNGCRSLTEVTFPEGLKTIGKNSFYGCTSLKGVTIPRSVSCIAEGAFKNCMPGFEISGYSGSDAQRYADENGIRFKALE